jgi:hypothetical protein
MTTTPTAEQIAFETAKATAAIAATSAPAPSAPTLTPDTPAALPIRDDWRSGLADARLAWIRAGGAVEAFDNAAKDDGYVPVAPPAPELVAHAAANGLPLKATPADFAPIYPKEYASSLTPAQLAGADGEFRSLAADLGMPAGHGNALIERLIQVGPMVSKMNDQQKSDWQEQQDKLAASVIGEGKVAVYREKAAALLGKAKGPLAEHLRSTAVLSDFYLTLALANHSDALALAAATHPHRHGKP